ncbi:MAG: LAGLIDADG family homing endonuclease, partial [Petrotogales bacterium]
FLSAYFDGDGSISLDPDRITFFSVSQKLVEGAANLLLKENIIARYHKTKKRKPGKKVLEKYKKLGKKPIRHQLFHLVLTGEDKYRFAEYVRPVSSKKKMRSKKMFEMKPSTALRLINYNGINYRAVSYSDYTFDIVKELKMEEVNNDSTYCLDIEGNKLEDKAVLWHNQLIQIRCDGDEDGLMLLMDALLNFSHSYIPDKRGGKMDLPLILTTRLDPAEVDKEAHNIDTLARYPLDFYLATLKHEHSKNLEPIMGLVSSRMGTYLQYEQFGFTHDTDDISVGPKESLYKTLKSMTDKMNVQLALAAKIRAVDEADVAYKVIERHFLPDVLGNLRAFSKQSVRCPLCNTTYRRIPIKGVCTKCGGKLTLTVHEMSVKKYLDISRKIADKYNLPTYARQRIILVEKSIDSLFESDKVSQTKIIDFF